MSEVNCKDCLDVNTAAGQYPCASCSAEGSHFTDPARPRFQKKEDPLELAHSGASSSEPLEPTKASDQQVGGSHYKKFKIQPIEFIVKNNLDYMQGNVIKYITRFRDKNGLEDLKKVKHYVDLIIEQEYTDGTS